MPDALPTALAPLYAQALMAITRADHEVGPEEGQRLHDVLARRAPEVEIEDLLLADPLRAETFAELVNATSGPFRGGMHARELAEVLVHDAMHILDAKGHVSDAEARSIIRFAGALGCSLADLARIAPSLSPWLGAR